METMTFRYGEPIDENWEIVGYCRGYPISKRKEMNKSDYMSKRSGKNAWTYYFTNYNRDVSPIKNGAGSTAQGNDRYVVEVKDNRRRFLRYTNAKGQNDYLDFPIKFPTTDWESTKTDKELNRVAVEQGIISQEEFDYWYE